MTSAEYGARADSPAKVWVVSVRRRPSRPARVLEVCGSVETAEARRVKLAGDLDVAVSRIEVVAYAPCSCADGESLGKDVVR